MKRLVLALVVLMLVVPAVGCAETEKETPPAAEAVSSCVACHTDKSTLKEVAAPEKEVKSEATTGEG